MIILSFFFFEREKRKLLTKAESDFGAFLLGLGVVFRTGTWGTVHQRLAWESWEGGTIPISTGGFGVQFCFYHYLMDFRTAL